MFMGYAIRCPIPFELVRHHLMDMTAKMDGMGKKQKLALMNCRDLVELNDFVEDRWGRGERVALPSGVDG